VGLKIKIMKTIKLKEKITESELMKILEDNKKVIFKTGDLTVFSSFSVSHKVYEYLGRVYYVSFSVYIGDDLLLYLTTRNVDSLLYVLNNPYENYGYRYKLDIIKSNNGNYLFPIKGRYAMHYVWYINEEIAKLSSESEYNYLVDNWKYDCEVMRDIPNQVQMLVDGLEASVGEFLPYYEHKRLYLKILRKIFGDAFEREENDGTRIALLGNSYKSAILDWDGAYDTPYASDIDLEEITKKYQLVFINHSDYRNDYMGRKRSISCDLNTIEFDSSGNYGCVNGLAFELKIYKRKEEHA